MAPTDRDDDYYSVGDAARTLGISLDTLRRWDRRGRIATRRDSANRRIVPASEIDRLRTERGDTPGSDNHLPGVVSSVDIDGLLARVEIQVTEPARIVATITREALEELGLRRGDTATGVIESTSVMVES